MAEQTCAPAHITHPIQRRLLQVMNELGSLHCAARDAGLAALAAALDAAEKPLTVWIVYAETDGENGLPVKEGEPMPWPAHFASPAVGYGITAHRLASSFMGRGSAPLKGRDGRAQLFATLDQARAEADRLNRSTASPHVHYTADPTPQTWPPARDV